MTIRIIHAKVSGKAAGGDSTRVYGTHWDADHTVTGLESVDNTSDANKPVSTATQTALDAKQNLDATLTALAGVTTAADKVIYATGSDAFATTDLTSTARSLLDDTSTSAMRTTLGVAIGSDVQAFDSDLSALAALATTGLVARTGVGTVSTRAVTAPAAGITVSNGDGVSGNPTLVLANDLSALEGLASTGIAVRTTTDTWAQRTVQAPAAGITITNPAGVAGDPTLVLANDLSALEGLSSTGIARRTGTDTWSVGTLVTNAELATAVAYTLKGNATGSTASVTDFTIAGLTHKASPTGSDKIIISDAAASEAFKYATLSEAISGVTAGVSSIAGNTGAFTLANGIDNSTNQIQLTAARRTLPTVQTFTSGSGTYTTPPNVLWAEVIAVGGGDGGAGSGTGASGGAGGTGGNTTFGTFTAGGGVGGDDTGGAGGTGGTVSGSPQMGIAGGRGGGSVTPPGIYMGGAMGGASALGGNGGGGAQAGAGTAGATNSGGGGGGGGSGSSTAVIGGGGGAGAYFKTIINTPSATYSYAVGAAGTAGTAGTSGFAGGAGGSGFIQVIEHYGS